MTKKEMDVGQLLAVIDELSDGLVKLTQEYEKRAQGGIRGASLSWTSQRLDRWKRRAAKTLNDVIGRGEGDEIGKRGRAYLDQEFERVSGYLFALREEVQDHPESFLNRTEDEPQAAPIAATMDAVPDSTNIFVVHGHDEAAKISVARLLEKFELHPIILHEQANEGRTIIEKFEDHSDVAFAVVLLTPDDICVDAQGNENEKRARQNVILEFGYFLGKLGRGKVCALYKDGTTLPSDYDGVLYVAMDDAGAWQFQLAKEMKAAGMDVDLNLLT